MSGLLSFFSRVSADDYKQHVSSVIASQPLPPLPPRRPPGRPKKRPVVSLVDSSSSSSSSSSSASSSPSSTPPSASTKRIRIDWFDSSYIHDILEAVRLNKSARGAVHYLQNKYRRLPTEAEGRFDRLNESTVRAWFDDEWRLKPQYQPRVAAGSHPKWKPKAAVLDEHEEVKRTIIARLTRMREADGNATITRDIARTVMMKVIKKYKPEIVDKLKVSIEFVGKFLRDEMGWSLRRGTTPASKLPEHWIDLGVAMAKRMAALISMHGNVHKSLIVNLDQTGVQRIHSVHQNQTQIHSSPLHPSQLHLQITSSRCSTPTAIQAWN